MEEAENRDLVGSLAKGAVGVGNPRRAPGAGCR